MRKYDEEFKREAVRKVFDWQSVASVARELGVAEGLIHNWKKVVKAGNSADENEVIWLKKKLRLVEMENEILKKAALIFGTGRVERHGFIGHEKASYPVGIMCRVLKVSRSEYYAYAKSVGGKKRAKGAEIGESGEEYFLLSPQVLRFKADRGRAKGSGWTGWAIQGSPSDEQNLRAKQPRVCAADNAI